MIMSVHPVAVQRGKTTEVTVDAKTNFAGAYQALFEGQGLQAEVVPPPAGQATVSSVKLKVTVAPDALAGVREFRVATSLGVSSVAQLVIVDEPVVLETAKPNNTAQTAQAVTLPAVVAGKIEAAEDLDYYKFEAKENEVVTFELNCARLQDKVHDLPKHSMPIITLYNGEGRELASKDYFYFADPVLSFKIPQTGTYVLQVRDSTYEGDKSWTYALRLTNRPYASHIFPMAGNPGATIAVEPIGSAGLVAPKVNIKVPSEPGIHVVQLDVKGEQTNPVTVISSSLPQVVEQEPNDDMEKATRVTLPCGINGQIGQPRDLDHYVFAAKKGQMVRFDLRARRFGTLLNSTLHGSLEVMTPKGVVVAGNDLSHGLAEASMVFTPSVDGDYILRVRDLNSKGAPSSVYYIEATLAEPDFTARCDPDKTMIGPGTSTPWYVHITRLNGFTGPVQMEVKGLPKDVTASPLTIIPEMSQGLIVLTASPTATLQAANVDVIATAKVKGADGKETTLVRRCTPNQETYFPGGGRGKFDVNLQTVGVTAASDILKVEVSTTQVTLQPGTEAKIDVTIHRRPDYDKNVSLDIIYQHLGAIIGQPLPPGVTIVAGKSKTLLGATSKGHFTLKADAKAVPVENVPICVLANVSINFVVKVPYSSPPILVTVKK
jgi:hypothetical protein